MTGNTGEKILSAAGVAFGDYYEWHKSLCVKETRVLSAPAFYREFLGESLERLLLA